MADIEYGRRVADALAGFDVGQSVAICERACVAARGHGRHRRHAAPRRRPGERPAAALVKVARRREHLLFDVPWWAATPSR